MKYLTIVTLFTMTIFSCGGPNSSERPIEAPEKTTSKNNDTTPSGTKAQLKRTPQKPKATPVPSMEDLELILNTKSNRWEPEIFSALENGMLPDEVKASFPNLEEVSQFGFAKAKDLQRDFISHFDFQFLKDRNTGVLKLSNVKIFFEIDLTESRKFQERLYAIADKKFEPFDSKSQENGITMWVLRSGEGYSSVTIYEMPETHKDKMKSRTILEYSP